MLHFLWADRRSNVLSQYESFWKKAVKDDSFVRHGSLERKCSTGSEKREQISLDDYATNLDNFRPVTLTMSSFYKQVSRCEVQHSGFVVMINTEDWLWFMPDFYRHISTL